MSKSSRTALLAQASTVAETCRFLAYGGLSAVVLMSSPALAAWPDDVSLTQLSSFQGENFTNVKANRDAYEQVIRELAAVVANKASSPAATSGIAGFDVALTSTVGFIDANGDGSSEPAAWERTHADADPAHVLWVPGISVRKGLPMSLEVGTNLGYVAFSRQTTFGAYGRWGLVEGYRQFPDFTVQVGYAGYLGNDELELGVMDASFSLGYDIPFGRGRTYKTSSFSPWVSAGLLRINAAPLLDADAQQELGVRAVSGFNGKDSYVEGFAPATISAGARLRSGDVQMLLSQTLVTTRDRPTSTIHVGIGYIY
jgi:hypothetical protein